ncbi:MULTISPECIES: hypothetical protein [unclassified Acidovorax]|uniref:hypothetical protein n=1 Tax=unclassified Acidovorax TaxID=2684926 RepID=UPI000AF538A6|nr:MULTISPECIES: hypothetical protein [unclassified Acidovorax]
MSYVQGTPHTSLAALRSAPPEHTIPPKSKASIEENFEAIFATPTELFTCADMGGMESQLLELVTRNESDFVFGKSNSAATGNGDVTLQDVQAYIREKKNELRAEALPVLVSNALGGELPASEDFQAAVVDTLRNEYGKSGDFDSSSLKWLLELKGGIFTHDDGPALERLWESGGKYAAKFEVPEGHLGLLSEDFGDEHIDVILEPHQNKHQSPEITGLDPYSGGRGTEFPASCGLAWHTANTAAVVRDQVRQAVADGSVTKDGAVFCPKKDAIGGIIYDTSISFDQDTGSYVASYHCNPVLESYDPARFTGL